MTGWYCGDTAAAVLTWRIDACNADIADFEKAIQEREAEIESYRQKIAYHESVRADMQAALTTLTQPREAAE
jgi:hypothetical protein